MIVGDIYTTKHAVITVVGMHGVTDQLLMNLQMVRVMSRSYIAACRTCEGRTYHRRLCPCPWEPRFQTQSRWSRSRQIRWFSPTPQRRWEKIGNWRCVLKQAKQMRLKLLCSIINDMYRQKDLIIIILLSYWIVKVNGIATHSSIAPVWKVTGMSEKHNTWYLDYCKLPNRHLQKFVNINRIKY